MPKSISIFVCFVFFLFPSILLLLHQHHHLHWAAVRAAVDCGEMRNKFSIIRRWNECMSTTKESNSSSCFPRIMFGFFIFALCFGCLYLGVFMFHSLLISGKIAHLCLTKYYIVCERTVQNKDKKDHVMNAVQRWKKNAVGKYKRKQQSEMKKKKCQKSPLFFELHACAHVFINDCKCVCLCVIVGKMPRYMCVFI